MRLSYIGTVKEGKLYISKPRRAQMAADIAKMREGALVEVELRKLPRRSNEQNAYYWGVCVALVCESLQALGHEVNAELTHEFLKGKFNAKPLCNADGEWIGEIGETTTKLSKDGFSEYMEKIKAWAATYLSLVIPDPEQQTELFTPSPSTILLTKTPDGMIAEGIR